MSKFYGLIDADRPSPLEPYALCRSADDGGPPWEKFDPADGSWKDASDILSPYFVGDDDDIAPIPDGKWGAVADLLEERSGEPEPNPASLVD